MSLLTRLLDHLPWPIGPTVDYFIDGFKANNWSLKSDGWTQISMAMTVLLFVALGVILVNFWAGILTLMAFCILSGILFYIGPWEKGQQEDHGYEDPTDGWEEYRQRRDM